VRPATGALPHTDWPGGPSAGWRRHLIRGIVLAIAVIAVIKAILFDVFPVQTSSMAPTLDSGAGGGDRVVASRIQHRLFGLHRFDVVTFRYGNNREVAYLKRLVGLPGEQILIRGGDLYAGPGDAGGDVPAASAAGLLAIARKDEALVRALLDAHPVVDAGTFRTMDAKAFAGHFALDAEAPLSWRFEDGTLEVLAEGSWAFAWTRGVPVPMRREPGARGAAATQEAADLSLRFLLLAADSGLTVSFQDPGLDPAPSVHMELLPGGGLGCAIRRGPILLGRTAVPRAAGLQGVELRVENVDDRVRILAGTRRLLARDYWAPPPPPHTTGRAGLTLSGGPGRTRVRLLGLHRDLHYLADGEDRFLVPDGAGLALGDRPEGSADSRAWREVEIEVQRTRERLRGDGAAVTARDLLLHDGNPYIEPGGGYSFVERTGRTWRFEASPEFRRVGTYPTPLVRLADVEARGLAIFHPFPRAGVLR
jgi:hypothetical protein